MTDSISLDIASLLKAYRTSKLQPKDVIEEVYRRIAARGNDAVWIHLIPQAEALAQAEVLASRNVDELPLYGIPFAVKDNIDVAKIPTTAACPGYSYIPETTATVVDRLLQAGAILIGKTNLDQFATGLVGMRSPYGACSSVFHEDYISGGSSSGSAVAVAAGLVSFSLGTDTAGSGRVPAAFNNIVGLKPTRGVLSTSGVVPACRSLDCVSIFTLNCQDAATVWQVAKGFDTSDCYSRQVPPQTAAIPSSFFFGVPKADQLQFFGDAAAAELYEQGLKRLEAIGGNLVEIDFQPFHQAANLLYSGVWVAERLAAIQSFFETQADAIHPVVRQIISNGVRYTAVDTFKSFYALEALKQEATQQWQKVNILALPTTGTIYTKAEVKADPIALNTNLGYYTNFVNLMDLCAIALPSGFRANGLPFGITLIGQAFQDAALCELGDRYDHYIETTYGKTTPVRISV
ncbi:allophanate hydrolase [Nostoc sp. CENA67]|uniref:Allophanate hydrolase n=1 Tax=Amazonocrinis nigriterrae CENA67 TaxID=2794033 RepID=A0A8J7L8Z3_9NOST|nr:allophanate hydrolase [Amazonocrinis nigriterrae]MBH8564979.1 allophanate hydrolase [Amazonocrinis nigriterrae CENA67]